MKKFNEIYEEIYNQNMEDLEFLKKERRRTFITSTCIEAIILIGIVAIFSLGQNSNTINELQFIILPILILAIVLVEVFRNALLKNTKYKIAFKEKVITPFVKNIDENLNYYPSRGISPFLYVRGDFETYNKYISEDSIEGVIEGKYSIKMAEVEAIQESVDAEGNKTRSTVFHGIFGNTECSKSITTTLRIRSDKGIIGKLFDGKTKVEMDSIEFEKYFDVEADNRIIAMQILTSEVMEMMVKFREKYKIKYEMTIKENQIFIRFHTGNVFEPDAFKSSLDYDTLKKYYDIIYFIFKVSMEINKAIENTEI